MIRVSSTRIVSKYACAASLQGCYYVAPLYASVPHSYRYRSAHDRFVQGGVFDKFGNKSVAQSEWSGVVASTPKGMKLYSSPPGGSPTTAITPPIPHGKVSSRMSGALLQQGVTYEVLKRPSTSEINVSWVRAHGTTGGAVILYCSARVYRDYSRGRWRISLSDYDLGRSGDSHVISQTYVSAVSPILLSEFKSSDKAIDFLPIARSYGQTLLTAIARDQERNYPTPDIAPWGRVTIDPSYVVPGAVSTDALDAELAIVGAQCRHGQWTPSELSSTARDIVEQYNDFDSNGLAYLADLRNVGDTIRSIVGLSHGVNLKSLAGLWLSGRFGDRLTISDTRKLLKSASAALRKSYYTIHRATLTSLETTVSGYAVQHKRVSHVITRPRKNADLMAAIDALLRWDVWPTLENTWDLVPLSFVVDWFIPVQDILAQIDATVEAPYLQAVSQYASDKAVMRYTPSVPGMSGDLTLTRYARGKYGVLSDIRPFEATTSVPTFGVVNAVDLVALVVQSL